MPTVVRGACLKGDSPFGAGAANVYLALAHASEAYLLRDTPGLRGPSPASLRHVHVCGIASTWLAVAPHLLPAVWSALGGLPSYSCLPRHTMLLLAIVCHPAHQACPCLPSAWRGASIPRTSLPLLLCAVPRSGCRACVPVTCVASFCANSNALAIAVHLARTVPSVILTCHTRELAQVAPSWHGTVRVRAFPGRASTAVSLPGLPASLLVTTR